MITLKTLPQATAQEVFDQAAKHLIKQGKKSKKDPESGGYCAYRAGKLRCAAGCFISDEEYNQKFENEDWGTLVMRGIAPPEHRVLIEALQEIHDSSKVSDWEYDLEQLAYEKGLEYGSYKD